MTEMLTSEEPVRTADELVSAHLAIVGYLVNEISMRLPAHVDRDDLTGAGLVGLVQAAASFDHGRGVPFSRYASVRIRGAIVDELRSRDWVSRSVRSRSRARDEAADALAAVLGRTPTNAELADYLGVPVSQLEAVEEDLHRSVVLRLDAAPDPGSFDAMLPNNGVTPEDTLVRREQVGYLHAAVAALPERLRVVVSMYFLEGRPMADIADILEVSESRVSQMRAEALALLRDGMNSQLDPEQVATTTRPGGCVDRRRESYFAGVAAGSDFRSRLTPLAEEGLPVVPERRLAGALAL